MLVLMIVSSTVRSVTKEVDMKVKELIEELSKLDPELAVGTTTGAKGWCQAHTNPFYDTIVVKKAKMNFADGSSSILAFIGPDIPTHSGYRFEEVK